MYIRIPSPGREVQMPNHADIERNEPKHNVSKFPRRDSKPEKRLRENRAVIHINNNAHGIALFSWSLFSGLESLLWNSCLPCS